MLNIAARVCPGALQRPIARMAGAPCAGLVGAQLRDANGDFQLSHVAPRELEAAGLVHQEANG